MVLDDERRRLLNRVASGAAIADLAEEFCCSLRSMYRELAKLWKALGVPNRFQAVRKAAAEGLLDEPPNARTLGAFRDGAFPVLQAPALVV